MRLIDADALERETYMPGLVQDYIMRHIREIPAGEIEIMIRDIDEADRITEHALPTGKILKIDGLGDTKIDRPGWEKFREFLREAKGE